MDRIRERLALGRTRYTHGVRVDDDTRTWGTKSDSWLEMADEELLDCLIYIVADYIRQTRWKDDSIYEFEYFMGKDEDDDNLIILHILENWELMEACRHKTMICALFNMV
jgi:hypothetical protein